MLILAGIIAAVLSYLLGSCNSAIIVIKILKREDVREFGSKNAGLTNVLRCYGKLAALFTLLGDLAKGVAAVLLSRLVFWLFGFGGDEYVFLLRTVAYASGFCAVLGHIFPVYHGFKGGKGILTAATTLLAIDPLNFALIIAVFALILLISKYVSLASVLSAVCNPFLVFGLNYFLHANPLGESLAFAVIVLAQNMLLIYMHKSNIVRLRAGTESKITDKRKKGDGEHG